MASYQSWVGISLVIFAQAIQASLPPLQSPDASYCRQDCTCDIIYQLVKCVDLGINYLPYAAVRNNTRVLHLSGNTISSLTPDTLHRFRQLRLLDLANNEISEIADDAFLSQPKMIQLGINGNHLSRVPVVALAVLKSLRALNLAKNKIEFLAAGSFANLTKLQILSLASNGLQMIDSGAFLGLNSLRTLNLDHNFLEEIPAGSLSSSSRLQQLHLSGNMLGTFVNHSESLGEFSVRSWFAPTEPNRLETLDLSHNLIDMFAPSCFAGMSELSELDLNSNYILEISTDLFRDLRMLKTLILSRNSPLHAVPSGVFRNTVNLMVLKLKKCQLTHLSADLFSNTSRLEVLDLTGNGLSGTSFLSANHMPYLRELLLRKNSIVHIQEDRLVGFSMLEVLDLSDNMLRKLPDLHSLRYLQTLDLGSNDLTWLGEYAFNGTSLTMLDLSWNKFQTIKESTFLSLPEYSQAKIDLSGNPWICDCRLEWTLKKMIDQDYTLADIMYCVWPRSHKGASLYSNFASNRKLLCTEYPKRENLYLLIGTWFGVVAAVILAFWAAAFHHAQRRFRARQPRERFLLFRNPNETNPGTTSSTGHSKVRFKALDSETESLEDDETTV